MTEPATVTVSTAQPEDFFQLLKPRVMSLVIFTAVTGLVVAGGDLDWLSSAIAILCIAVGAGAAGALNMALEGETDADSLSWAGVFVAGESSTGPVSEVPAPLPLFGVGSAFAVARRIRRRIRLSS